jgi:signal transduction histidine kinase
VTPSIANYPAGLAHDARNLLAAMDIYCELLKAPGVLDAEHRHLADELLLLRDSSSSLVDRMLVQALQLGTGGHPEPDATIPFNPAALSAIATDTLDSAASSSTMNDLPGRKRVDDVASELLASHKMLAALAGPKVHVEMAVEEAPGGELMIAAADFTRVLINLVRNAAEAMGTGGRILITVKPAMLAVALGPSVLLSVEDNGPGIPLALLERIFELSSNTEASNEHSRRRMSFRPRGLGLRIVRELVEGGGGMIHACRLPERGSRFEIVLPMVTKNDAAV